MRQVIDSHAANPENYGATQPRGHIQRGSIPPGQKNLGQGSLGVDMVIAADFTRNPATGPKKPSTSSHHGSAHMPSTPTQFIFAQQITKKMKKLEPFAGWRV
jgi:hypothetical protein